MSKYINAVHFDKMYCYYLSFLTDRKYFQIKNLKPDITLIKVMKQIQASKSNIFIRRNPYMNTHYTYKIQKYIDFIMLQIYE